MYIEETITDGKKIKYRRGITCNFFPLKFFSQCSCCCFRSLNAVIIRLPLHSFLLFFLYVFWRLFGLYSFFANCSLSLCDQKALCIYLLLYVWSATLTPSVVSLIWLFLPQSDTLDKSAAAHIFSRLLNFYFLNFIKINHSFSFFFMEIIQSEILWA